MEENKTHKISYAKNLNKINFSSTISTPIDNNVNIKTILDVDSYVYDTKIDCSNGKAVITGRIAIKVLYIDVDNITNTITDSQTFSETFLDNSITSDCTITLTNINVVPNVAESVGTLKVNCEVSICPTIYLNLAINNNLTSFDEMIVRKSEIQTYSISSVVNTNFEYVSTFETKDTITKILSYKAHFAETNTTANEGYAVVEGKIYATMLYETTENDQPVIKQLCETFIIKNDLELKDLVGNESLDLSYSIDTSKEQITTDFEDENNVVTIKHCINVNGVSYKSLSLDVVDDLFSINNEVDTTLTDREFTKQINNYCYEENVFGETTLNSDEPAIDEIISNTNISPEVTNSYIKDETLYIEGVITSNIVYIDENKDYRQKQMEIPFIINTKLELKTLPCSNIHLCVVACKTKAKRGTIVEVDYTLHLCVKYYEKDIKTMVDNFTIGKNVDFSQYDYQIFIAKPGETLWELSKRIKISPDNLQQYNKNLPLVMDGGERVIIKR